MTVAATDSYSRVARWLHWGMALLIVGNLAGGFLHDAAPRTIIPLHKATGILIMALTIARFGWRLGHRPPPFPAHMPNWERWLAHLGHMGLYALMIVVPLSGWIMASGSEWPISFFGLFEIPKFPVEQSEAFVEAMEERHEMLAFALIGLLGLHIVAAFRHHFVLKDTVLSRMLR